MKNQLAKNAPSIVPVILSGGSGTRLWPLSRADHPKQLIPMISENTMLQDTVLRVNNPEFMPPMVVCNQAQRFIIAEQLRQIEVTPQSILLEPVQRNTAPAIATVAVSIAQKNPESLMLVLPSDHIIKNMEAFRSLIFLSAEAALQDKLVLFGIIPTHPATGYGYISKEQLRAGSSPGYTVNAFHEKPTLSKAEEYLTQGYYWNSGMFLFKASAFLEELNRLDPGMLETCRASVEQATLDGIFTWLEPDLFSSLPAKSVDNMVMENTRKAVVVPADIGWNDLGVWEALWNESEKDKHGNRLVGDVISHKVKNSYIRTEGPLTTVVGLENIVVITTNDAVLVVAKDKSEEVRELLKEMNNQDRQEHLVSELIYRPWGSFRTIETGAAFNIKQLTINPGAQISLQMHLHRSEHWILMQGTAKVTRGEESFLLYEKESTYISSGVVHRLENPGHIPLQLIEVQLGNYFGEDDIIRLEDTYGRVTQSLTKQDKSKV